MNDKELLDEVKADRAAKAKEEAKRLYTRRIRTLVGSLAVAAYFCLSGTADCVAVGPQAPTVFHSWHPWIAASVAALAVAAVALNQLDSP